MDVLPSAVFWLMPKCSNKSIIPDWPPVANTGVRSDWPRIGIRIERRMGRLCLVSWQHWCAKCLTLWRRFRHRNERSPGVSQCRFWPWRLHCGLGANDWLSNRWHIVFPWIEHRRWYRLWEPLTRPGIIVVHWLSKWLSGRLLRHPSRTPSGGRLLERWCSDTSCGRLRRLHTCCSWGWHGIHLWTAVYGSITCHTASELLSYGS